MAARVALGTRSVGRARAYIKARWIIGQRDSFGIRVTAGEVAIIIGIWSINRLMLGPKMRGGSPIGVGSQGKGTKFHL